MRKATIILALLLVFGMGWRIQNSHAGQPPPDLNDVTEVAHQYFNNLTSGTGLITLATPATEGDYQVMVQEDWNDFCGSDTLTTETITWTNTLRSRSVTTQAGPGTCGSQPQIQQVLFIHVAANTPILFSIGYSGGTANVPYTAEVVLTKE